MAALIGIIIIAALLALVQINAQRTGSESPIATAGTSVFAFVELAVTSAASGTRSFLSSLVELPQLARDNGALREQNEQLVRENARLHELSAEYAAETAVRPVIDLYGGVEARVIGFPPENESREVTIDKGSNAGVVRDDGVVAPGGAIGRVESVGPFSSTVVLITDFTSRIPAIVRRGRWWGIARGNLTSVRVEYIPEDAPMRVGDAIVTGEGRSFHAGVPIGTVTAIERGDATLYQTAVVKPAAALGALDRVVVVTR